MLNCLKPIQKEHSKNGGVSVNKKGISTLVIVAIIVIAVVIAGIAVYVLYSGGGEEGPTPTPTPTSPVEGATSMRFDVNITVDGALEIDRFTVKNLGTSDILLRVDQTDKDGLTFLYLMHQTDQKAWAYCEGQGSEVSSDFATYWDSTLIGNAAVDKYMTALANWSGTGNYEGDSFTIYDIYVNPTLDDSAFQPTS
jgi:hypothetical protein